MKKYLNIAFWIFVAIYFFVVLGFVNSRQKRALCTSINVKYIDSLAFHFIDKDDLIQLIDEKEEKVLGRPMNEINILNLEKLILTQAYVKSAEVYTELNGRLNVKIAQRMPLVRIINNKNYGFYIDNEGYLLPLSKKVSLRLLVASGNINFSPDFDTIMYIYDKPAANMKLLQDILTIADFINNNEFWKAQIQQIYVNSKQEFELVPLVGAQIIYFGTINNYKEKFAKLEATYKKGFLYKGWSKYKSINLKYEHQVVCEKK